MNKNVTPIILIVLALGIYFTFTRVKIDDLQVIREVNNQYQQAIDNSERLVKVRDDVLNTYNKIDPKDRQNLNKMLPDNVDNVRLIIDVNGIGQRNGLTIKNIKTSASAANAAQGGSPNGAQGAAVGAATVPTRLNASVPTTYDTVTVSFNVSTDYQTFLRLLKDLQASLRIMDITKISLNSSETGIYDYGVELKTYWLKQ